MQKYFISFFILWFCWYLFGFIKCQHPSQPPFYINISRWVSTIYCSCKLKIFVMVIVVVDNPFFNMRSFFFLFRYVFPLGAISTINGTRLNHLYSSIFFFFIILIHSYLYTILYCLPLIYLMEDFIFHLF